MHAHIKQCHKDAEIVVHPNWPESKLRLDENRLRYKLRGYPNFNDKDYWDIDPWQCFKDSVQMKAGLAYIIIFCSYGNEAVRSPLT
ncbi:hypothetical protein CPB86DRAFT_787150 [Serendipita vermifera]|nr:hypothetical protein CPB86DRAFT_787150 [Serendipita vermifera]